MITARSVEDETRNAELNGNRNPEWWGDFSQLQIQIKQTSHFEFVPRDTSEFKSNQNLNSTLYREIPRNLIFSILTSWLKSPHHSGFRLPFNSVFRVSSSTERADFGTTRFLKIASDDDDCFYYCTVKSSLVPLFEGLWSSNSWEFELSGFETICTTL